MKSKPSIAILLCTYNGQDNLSKQLDSFAAQTYTNWMVWVSDDSSYDQTLDILRSYKAAWEPNKLHIKNGPQKGYPANFMALICDASIDADYYAFSDQDDIWDPNKLFTALYFLKEILSEIPAIYCGRTLIVDQQNKAINFSPLFKSPPCFANALVQNIAGGNTMVLNKAARNVIAKSRLQGQIISHDWWAYLVVTGCGGKVIYDPVPYVRYRQHDNNLVGSNRGLLAFLVRLKRILQGSYKSWIDTNINGLYYISNELTSDNLAILNDFSRARKKPYPIKILSILFSKVHRQTTIENIFFHIASFFNRV
jgi:glycosyltransferase involved in cell wall biosynthesis